MPTGVLIIEGEARLGRNMQIYLERSGFAVRKAENGEDGLDEFRRFAPEVVLLDFGLPDLDGFEMLQRLLALDARTKVIILTSTGLDPARQAALNAGAWSCMAKPLALRELRELLEKFTVE